MIFELVKNFAEVLDTLPEEHSRRRILKLLESAIRRDVQFIGRHPTTLFQCMWNVSWWFDCPEAAQHFEEERAESKKTLVDDGRLYQLVETWRRERIAGGKWLRSCRPPAFGLDQQQVAKLTGHRGKVESVSFSPNGDKLVSSSSDKTIRLWDALLATETMIVSCEPNVAWSVAFSPDGRLIACGMSDGTVRLWDADTVDELCVLRGHMDEVTRVAWSADGSRLASGGRDTTVCVWDVISRTLLRTLTGHDKVITGVAFLESDSEQCVIACCDDSIRKWTIAQGVQTLVFNVNTSGIHGVSVSPNGNHVASCSGAFNDYSVRIWNCKTGELIEELEGHEFHVTAVAYSSEGRLASSSWDHTIRVWDSSERANVLRGHSQWVTCLCYSSDGLIASGSSDNTIRIWNPRVGTDNCGKVRGHKEYITALAFSRDGARLATCSWDRTIRVWNSENGCEVAVLRGHADKVTCVALSPDGLIIASGSEDLTIRLWDIRSGHQLKVLSGHTDLVTSVDYSPDGNQLVSGSHDTTIRLWDIESGEQSAGFRHENSCVNCVAFSQDGSVIVSGGGFVRCTILFWDVEKRECISSMPSSRDISQIHQDVYEVVRGRETRFRGVAVGAESVVTDRATAKALAWWPDPLSNIRSTVDCSVWTGALTTEVKIFRLEEE